MQSGMKLLEQEMFDFGGGKISSFQMPVTLIQQPNQENI